MKDRFTLYIDSSLLEELKIQSVLSKIPVSELICDYIIKSRSLEQNLKKE